MNIIIKVGGAFLKQVNNQFWLDDIIKLKEMGHQIFIVHGAGPYITDALRDAGVDSRFHNGQRITSQTEINVIENVLSHQINPMLTNEFTKRKCPAIGVSGADGEILKCDYFNEQLGQVGKVLKVNIDLLSSLSKSGIVVLSPIGIGNGIKFNVNADVAAVAIAKVLPESQMIFLTGENGLLDSKKKVIPQITSGMINALVENKTIQGGMIVKVEMIQELLKTSPKVAILNGQLQSSLTNFISHKAFKGTVFTA